jgi:hypothetical protein
MEKAIRDLRAELNGMRENVEFHQSALSSGILEPHRVRHHAKLKKECMGRIEEIRLLLRSEKD